MRSGPARLRAAGGCLSALLCATAVPALAQQPAAEQEIVIYGERRLVGVRAERVLGPDDIAAYGLSNIGELLDEVTRERGESRDEPVYLVDGKRVSGLGDVESYPTEAIDRIQVLPSGSAMRIGASATRRVVNIILKPQVRTGTARASLAAATEGRANGRTGELTATDIKRPRRLGVALSNRYQDALLESDRDIVQPDSAPATAGRFRTLRPSVGGAELRLSAADSLTSQFDGSVTAKLAGGRTVSRLGLGADGGALEQRVRRRSGDVAAHVGGDIGEWLVELDAAYGYDRRRTVTDGDATSGPGETRTLAVVRNAGAQLRATGVVADLPAGPLSLSLRAGVERDSIASDSDRFVQWNRELGAGLQLPLASAAAGVLAPLGELSAGVELSRNKVSRIGALTNATFALQWQPFERLRIAGSLTTGRTPPGVALVAGPLLASPGARYLDPLTGETVDVVEITGGNPELGAQRAASRRLSIRFEPLPKLPLTLTTEYLVTRNRDIVTALPPGSDLLLLIFPDRFTRDAGGRLIQVDTRPVSFERSSERQLRSSAELNLPLGGRDGGSRARRLQVNLSHRWLIESEVEIRGGFDPVDLLSPNAVGIGGAGRPRHQFDFTLGYAERGLGVRLTGEHRGSSFLSLSGGSAPTVLRFSPLTSLSVRGFIDGARLAPSANWLKGSRLTLSVINIANARERVRDGEGLTPLRYQPAYRDPVGRTVQAELRKAF